MNKVVLKNRIVIGGIIGLTLISLFLFGTGEPDPLWGKFWWIRPLLIVTFAGAVGGACNYFITQQGFKNKWTRAGAMMVSSIIFIIGLWIGTVLGLAGTYWH